MTSNRAFTVFYLIESTFFITVITLDNSLSCLPSIYKSITEIINLQLRHKNEKVKRVDWYPFHNAFKSSAIKRGFKGGLSLANKWLVSLDPIRLAEWAKTTVIDTLDVGELFAQLILICQLDARRFDFRLTRIEATPH